MSRRLSFSGQAAIAMARSAGLPVKITPPGEPPQEDWNMVRASMVADFYPDRVTLTASLIQLTNGLCGSEIPAFDDDARAIGALKLALGFDMELDVMRRRAIKELLESIGE